MTCKLLRKKVKRVAQDLSFGGYLGSGVRRGVPVHPFQGNVKCHFSHNAGNGHKQAPNIALRILVSKKKVFTLTMP